MSIYSRPEVLWAGNALTIVQTVNGQKDLQSADSTDMGFNCHINEVDE